MPLLRALEKPLWTPRLRLEPMTPALAEAAASGPVALADALNADIPEAWAPAGMRLLAQVRRAGASAAAPIRAVVVHSVDERVIGDVRFEPALLSEATAEIGYEIITAYRRQGYAAEATRRVIDWLFDEAGAETVIAGCHMRNRASVRTLRKLGFLLDGARRGRAFWWVMTPDIRPR